MTDTDWHWPRSRRRLSWAWPGECGRGPRAVDLTARHCIAYHGGTIQTLATY